MKNTLGSKPSFLRPTVLRPTVKKQKKPSGPLSFFDEKRNWQKGNAKKKLSQSRLIPGSGSKYYKKREIDQMLDKRFPWSTDRGFISRSNAISELKKMRMEEHRAKTGEEKRRIKEERDFLTQGFGLKGKY
ncbi:MAG TPA: hypothetical protein ENI19_00765 [Candidatus Nealsonbacteria bacterium]|uniref:Uncharacterized protein n=1 Tax=marine sediment metagenome TaxID=412755 RepID=A0A0F9VBJ2_9ZZZZ|nr:hypothetical protein [Candidatus Nealsonbacteria bacterium]HEB46224.1 hypothetical protein [Candidatus Nealsonbacteria bacterium]